MVICELQSTLKGRILIILSFFKEKDKEKYLTAYDMVKTIAEFGNGAQDTFVLAIDLEVPAIEIWWVF